MSDQTQDIGDGWRGRKTGSTRVAFHPDGATIVFQDGTLIAQAINVTPAVLHFLFGDELVKHLEHRATGGGK